MCSLTCSRKVLKCSLQRSLQCSRTRRRTRRRREVLQMVNEILPTLEMNTAQSDDEVLEQLLRQLGYPLQLQEEARAKRGRGFPTLTTDPHP